MLESIPEEEMTCMRRGLRILFGGTACLHTALLVISLVRLLHPADAHVYDLYTPRVVPGDGLASVAAYAKTCANTTLLAWKAEGDAGTHGTVLPARVDEVNGFGLLAAVFACAAACNALSCVRAHQEDALESLRQPCALRCLEQVLTAPLQAVLVACCAMVRDAQTLTLLLAAQLVAAALAYPLEYAHASSELVDIDEVLPRGLVIGPTAPFAPELSVGRRVLGKAPDPRLIVPQDKRAAIAWGVCWGAATTLQTVVWGVLLEQVSALEGGCLVSVSGVSAAWLAPLRTLVLGQCIFAGLLVLVPLTQRAVTELGWADAHVSLLYGSIAYALLGVATKGTLAVTYVAFVSAIPLRTLSFAA